MTYNALAGGLLSGQHRFQETPEKGSRFDGNAMYQRRFWTREMFSRVEQVAEVARSEGLTPVELAYAWLATRPGVDSILVGPATVQHLDDALAAIGRPVSDAGRDEARRTRPAAWMGSDTHYVR